MNPEFKAILTREIAVCLPMLENKDAVSRQIMARINDQLGNYGMDCFIEGEKYERRTKEED